MQMQEEQTDAKLHKPAKCSISVSCYTVLVTNVHIWPTDNAPPYNKESSHSTDCHIPTRPFNGKEKRIFLNASAVTLNR